jgi:hypothetical protein
MRPHGIVFRAFRRSARRRQGEIAVLTRVPPGTAKTQVELGSVRKLDCNDLRVLRPHYGIEGRSVRRGGANTAFASASVDPSCSSLW